MCTRERRNKRKRRRSGEPFLRDANNEMHQQQGTKSSATMESDTALGGCQAKRKRKKKAHNGAARRMATHKRRAPVWRSRQKRGTRSAHTPRQKKKRHVPRSHRRRTNKEQPRTATHQHSAQKRTHARTQAPTKRAPARALRRSHAVVLRRVQPKCGISKPPTKARHFSKKQSSAQPAFFATTA